MNENTDKKIEIEYVANLDAAEKIPADQRLVVNISVPGLPNQKFELYALIPRTDEEAKARYGEKCSIAFLVEKGVRALTTAPQYGQIAYGEAWNAKESKPSGPLPVDFHQRMQNALDDYRVGNRGTGAERVAQKAKASAFDELMKKTGATDINELLVLVQKGLSKKAAGGGK